jgi:hypothetical protein
MEQDIHALRKQVQQLRLLIGVMFLTIFCLLIYSFRQPEDKFGIIRAKGIIIEDQQGRDRILLGAPLPASAHRVRTDTNLVRKHWAKNFDDPNQYMQWYSEYHNSGTGLVVMNEDGFDRVLVGDKLADPNTGKRMFDAAGILWNDATGWEKGGAGVNTSKDGATSRSVMGVDDSDGEAVHIIALEDGTKGLIIGGENGRVMIGMSKKDGKWFQNKEAFTGIKYFSNEGKLIWEQKMTP